MNAQGGVPAPDLPSDSRWLDGAQSAANREEKEWGSLEKVGEQNDVNWLRVYGIIVIAMAVTFSFIFLGSLVVWALHYMLPECWLWLSDHQLSKIQSVLFSGGMGAVISSLIKRQMDRLEAGKQK